MDKPLVSVLMPNFRYGKYLRECMDSVLNQTYDNLEVIFSDNGSYDGSREIVESYNDSRIKAVYLEHNIGFVGNVRACAKRATGKYCAFISTDDFWMPDKLEKQVKFLESNPDYGSVYSFIYPVDKDGNKIQDGADYFSSHFNRKGLTREKLLKSYFFSGTSTCILTILAKTNLFKEAVDTIYGIDLACDWHIMKWIIQRENACVIEERLACYRWHGENASTVNEEHVLFDLNERLILRSEFFDGMSREEFAVIFKEFLINKEVLSDEDMECEIINLHLLHSTNTECKLIALMRFFKNAENKKFTDAFFGKYGFSMEDINSIKRSYYMMKTDTDSIRLYPKFDRLRNYLINPKYNAAVFIKSEQLGEKFLSYTKTKYPEEYKRILCAVSENENSIFCDDIPAVSLNWAMRRHKINLILVISSNYESLPEDLVNKYTGEKIKLLSLISFKEGLYEL